MLSVQLDDDHILAGGRVGVVARRFIDGVLDREAGERVERDRHAHVFRRRELLLGVVELPIRVAGERRVQCPELFDLGPLGGGIKLDLGLALQSLLRFGAGCRRLGFELLLEQQEVPAVLGRVALPGLTEQLGALGGGEFVLRTPQPGEEVPPLLSAHELARSLAPDDHLNVVQRLAG